VDQTLTPRIPARECAGVLEGVTGGVRRGTVRADPADRVGIGEGGQDGSDQGPGWGERYLEVLLDAARKR
jgi:hypothetical protein